jgi:hypothetical protein
MRLWCLFVPLCEFLLPLAATAAVHVAGPAGPVSIEARSLPLTLPAREGGRLYIAGQRVEEARMERASDGTFMLNGVAFPLAPWAWITRHEPRWPDALTAAQESVARAGRARLVQVAIDEYRTARQAGWDEMDASRSALSAMRDADRDCLVDWGASPGATPGAITIYWKGLAPGSQYTIELKPERVAPDFARTELLDKEYATVVWYYASQCPDTCWVVVRRGGTGTAYCGAAQMKLVEAQLTRAFTTGELGEYPLPHEDVEAILSVAASQAEKGKSTLPN